MLRGHRATDVLVPAAALAVGLLELAVVRPEGVLWGAALETVTAVLLVGRRRWPLRTCAPAAVVMLWMPWAGPQLDDVAAPILLLAVICYALARWVRDLRGLLGLAVVLGMFFLDYLLVDQRAHGIDDVVFILSLVLPPYVLGRVVLRLDEQRQQIERQQEQLQQQAVREERDRIAREMHDVIAHSLSAMVVQTAAARDLVEVDPERAASVLDQVAETGRVALSETGRLLHLVRDEEDELGLRPAPGVRDLPALLASWRAGGLDVDAELRLPEEPLPGGVDVTTYRVVQEALTNAQRHGTGRARLVVESDERRVRVWCGNDSDGPARPGSGLGLRGMRERVTVVGGTLRHRDTSEGFELEVEIPVTEGAR